MNLIVDMVENICYIFNYYVSDKLNQITIFFVKLKSFIVKIKTSHQGHRIKSGNKLVH